MVVEIAVGRCVEMTERRMVRAQRAARRRMRKA
jgi:hypothetical protein